MSFASGAARRLPVDVRAVLAVSDVRLLLSAGLVSQTGDWILRLGISYQIYVLTGSTVASATALLVSLAPQVLLGSFAGACVDRWDRRWTMIIANLAMALVLIPLAFVRDGDQVWVVYLVLAGSSCVSPFFLAADATMLPALVERPTARVVANSLNAQVRDVARLIGAALGGVLAAGGGIIALAGADLVTFVVAAVLIGRLRHRPAPRGAQRTHLGRDWVDGLGVIRRSRALMVILVFLAVTGVGEAIMGTLFAPFVHDVLGGSARGYGLIVASQAVGGIVGGALVTLGGHRVPARWLFGGGAVAFGLLDLALFLYPLGLPGIWPAIVLIALVGLPGAALNAGLMTVLQTGTADRVRGRVFGTITAVQNATMLAATLVVGAAAQVHGILPVLVLQGVGYAVAGLVVLIVLPRTVGSPAPAAVHPAGTPLPQAAGDPVP